MNTIRNAIDGRRALARGLLLAAAVVACSDSQSRGANTSAGASTCGADARQVVEQLGARMRRVSVLGPDSIVRRELHDTYAPLVTPALLDEWQRTPSGAPGRQASNPWPARIDVRTVDSTAGGCRVEGDVVYVTTTDTLTVVERRPVTLRVQHDSGWRVSAYETAAAARSVEPDSASPADVVRRYYAAIDSGNYAAAYALWGQQGQASGKTRQQFAAGFAQTARTDVQVGDSVRLEGAAGSQYATVPVTVDAVLRNGTRQHFTGSYIIRRAMVDGATPEQRRWHIYKAQLRESGR